MAVAGDVERGRIHKFKAPKSDAERARLYRLRKKGILPVVGRDVAVNTHQVTRSAAQPNVTPDTSRVTSQPSQKPTVTSRDFVTIACDAVGVTGALSVSAVSLFMSVTGLTMVVPGHVTAVLAMGLAFGLWEIGAVTHLARHTDGFASRTTLKFFVTLFVTVNTIGTFGYLSDGQLLHAADSRQHAVELAGPAALADEQVSDLTTRIEQIYRIIGIQTDRGLTVSAAKSIGTWEAQRRSLESQKQTAVADQAKLKAEQAGSVEAKDPVEYLAARIGVSTDSILPWFLVALALLLDPAAVLLLYRVTRRRLSPKFCHN